MSNKSFDGPDNHETVAALLRAIQNEDIRIARSEGGSCLAISRIASGLNGVTWSMTEKQHLNQCSMCRTRLDRLSMSLPEQSSAASQQSPAPSRRATEGTAKLRMISVGRLAGAGERVLESRQIIGLFMLMLMLLFSGLFFTLGYMMGGNHNGRVRAATDLPKSDWEFYRAGDVEKPKDHLKPVVPASTPAPKNAPALVKSSVFSNIDNAPTGAQSESLAPDGVYTLQVAALSKEADALELAKHLQKKKFPAVVVSTQKNKYYLVQVGPYADQKSADAARKELEGAGFKIISDTPVTAAALLPGPNASGWNNSNVTVTLNSTDNELGGTGVKQINYSAIGAQPIASTNVSGSSASFTISTEGITTITFFGTDNAGNVETAKTITIQLDKTPPSITGSATPEANAGVARIELAGGWNNANVTVSFQCADSLSGLAPGSPPAPTILSAQGAGQSISGTCQDLAGNTSTATVNGINFDIQAPTFACAPAAADGMWHATNQAFACSAQDSLSGLSSGSPAGFSLMTTVPAGTETASALTTLQSLCDQAGNCVTAGPISGNMVDRKPPTISISTPGNGTTYAANQSVNAAYACADLGSGVATCAGTVASGSKIDTAPNGVSTPKAFVVNSTDNVGNFASQSINYVVSCHYVALGISPSIVTRGSATTVTGNVMSCIPNAQTISEKFTLTGPLGPSCTKTTTVMFTTPSFTIPTGTSKSVSFPFLIPRNACAGTYTTTSTTLQGGTAIDSTSTTLMVQ